MALQGNDRVIWLCLGVSLFFAVRGIFAELYRVKDLTEIRKPQKEDPVIGEATEDALRLETLGQLTESSSFDLRAAALRIISERASKGPTKKLLLDDLASVNPERRRKAVNTLSFLTSSIALGRSNVCTRLKDRATFVALVDCLCNFLKEHTEKTNDILSPIYPQTRPAGETKAMKTASLMLAGHIKTALEAGIVSRWLTNYPFPCVVRNKAQKQSIVFMMKTWWTDDPTMGTIINTISSDQEGLNHLRKYGLMGSRMEEHTAEVPGNLSQAGNLNIYHYSGSPRQVNDSNPESGLEENTDACVTNEEDTAGVSPRLGSRPQENTAEEQALRRRRREAMVFSEGSTPLAAANIFHPVDSNNSPSDTLGLRESTSSWANQAVGSIADQEAEDSETTRSAWMLWPF